MTKTLRLPIAAALLGLAACSGGEPATENVLIQNETVLDENVAADDLTLTDNGLGAADPLNEAGAGNVELPIDNGTANAL